LYTGWLGRRSRGRSSKGNYAQQRGDATDLYPHLGAEWAGGCGSGVGYIIGDIQILRKPIRMLLVAENEAPTDTAPDARRRSA
jgi:hypothetical protein